MLFDQFDRIRVINLVHRTDRRAEMEGELARIGLGSDPRVAFVAGKMFAEPGTFSSKGARGVYHSHLMILEEAAAANESVIILEDDADFLPAVMTYDLAGGFDIFYGAYEASNPADLANSDIIGAHFMGFSAGVVREIVSYLKEILNTGYHPPIDGAYVWFRRAHRPIRTIFATPSLAEQRPSRTDISETHLLDKMPGMRGFMSTARRIKRVTRRFRRGREIDTPS